jgi:beta-glucosidase/6-phospho-beta-glucosidase/beta-galactosidase
LSRHCGFNSFFLGGFESSCHVLRSGKRLDVIASTHHDTYVHSDYQRLRSVGIRTTRDAVRWHLVEKRPYRYDWSSAIPMVRAADDTGVQVIWDLCHYGWPDGLDIFKPEFIRRFCSFARSFASIVCNESDQTPYFAPMNEISFLAWGAGDMGFLNPFETGRGLELKCQLVRATIAAIDAIRDVAPHARFVQVDPVINVVTAPGADAAERRAAAAYTRVQYQAFDMIAGRDWPQLGGSPSYLDIVGGNYYVHNQWELNGRFIERTDARYRPLRFLLRDLYARYRKPIFVAETGIEEHRRAEWLSYISDEVIAALEDGVPVEGICLYPIVNHPGWDDDRHCHNGLWDYCNESGHREIYNPLADELREQTARIESVLARLHPEPTQALPLHALHAGEAGAEISA